MDLTLAEAASSRRVCRNEDISRALATYIRSLMSGDSRYDRFTNGDRAALSPEERNGLRLFLGRGNCTFCHVGPNFTDEKTAQHRHRLVPAADEAPRVGGHFVDEGRAGITGRPEDRGAFKTPTLREVGRTSPYMHDGSLATLEEVVDYYDRGGRANPQPRSGHPSARLPRRGQAGAGGVPASPVRGQHGGNRTPLTRTRFTAVAMGEGRWAFSGFRLQASGFRLQAVGFGLWALGSWHDHAFHTERGGGFAFPHCFHPAPPCITRPACAGCLPDSPDPRAMTCPTRPRRPR